MSDKQQGDHHIGLSTSPDASKNLDIVRDGTFYCHDMFVLVEKVIFKVPRAIFNGSEVFRDMLDLPQSADSPSDGATETLPLRLEGHSAYAFRQLLRLILPLQYNIKPNLTVDQWQTVLKLTTEWQFDEVRQTAINELEQAQMEPIDKLVVAVRYNIKEWTVEALNSICQRDRPISLGDAERLMEVVNLEYVLKITHVRESLDSSPVVGNNNTCYCNNHGRYIVGSCSNPTREQRSTKDFSAIIRSTFELQ